MGQIVSTRKIGDDIIHKVLVTPDESLALEGNIRNIKAFALDNCDSETKVVEWGKDGVTKFFLIPIKHKSKSKKKPQQISCQMMQTDTKLFFIYVVDYNPDMLG